MPQKTLWDIIEETPATITVECKFSQQEFDNLKALAEKRGTSLQTVMRLQAATINLSEPTVYRGVSI